jgi:hypothetical protein
MKTYHGSCHCGDVQFEADIEFAAGTVKCNCSICTKMRWWAALVSTEAFRCNSTGNLGEYRFLTRRDGHFFCARCGIHTHTTGHSPRLGPFVAVAVACLDDVMVDELVASPIRYLDGRNDVWDLAPADTRHL